MKKLLRFFDDYILKIGVSLVIAFIPLYPKLPSISITHTWVYIRLEDFLILAIVGLWGIQFLRKKVFIPVALGIPFAIYWFVGLCSLIFSIIFIGPHLSNFFPKIAALEYARRIEYMILFFVGFSSVRTKKDIRQYLMVLGITITGVLLYGLGQRFYLPFWAAFPDFARQFTFCFPSFQTGNEEFAKGIPLCLPQDARITSTFGGHYDLAAYLVVVIPIIIGVFSVAKKLWVRIFTGVLGTLAIMLLIFTASRISFAAYLVGVALTLIFLKRRKFIVPVFLVSLVLLVAFSGTLAKRFLETIRFTSIVTNTQGQVVGVAPATLPADLQKKVAKDTTIEENVPTQNLPTGSSFITLPTVHTPVATSVAVVKTALTTQQIKQLKLANGGVELSTVSGNFLVQKALVYDISFTTRFQGEWPNAWAAFMKNPALGSGYSSITLASDNDYLRALGESGFLGLASFLLIFIFFGILVKQTAPTMKDTTEKGLILGLAGGVIGLFINASLIDVFEASKVAESLWILLGIGAGTVFLYTHKDVDYVGQLKKLITSRFFISVFLVIVTLIVFLPTIGDFFISSDFTILHTAASETVTSIKQSFTHITNFTYQPLSHVFYFFLFTFFAFYPQGYHIISIILECTLVVGVYLLALRIFNKKIISIGAAVFFLLLPTTTRNVFWISYISIALASVVILFTVISYIKHRDSHNWFSYPASLLLCVIAFFIHEIALVIPVVILLAEYLAVKPTKSLKNTYMFAIPYICIAVVYLVYRGVTHSLGFAPLPIIVNDFSYVTSIIFVLIISYLILFIQKYIHKDEFVRNLISSIFILIIATLFMNQASIQNTNWNSAGQMTYNTLSSFRLNYDDIAPKTSFYFVGIPQQKNGVPVFDTGLQDSLWFIYRDDSRKVYSAASIDDAQNQATSNKGDSAIFTFDKNGNVIRIK